MFKILLVVAAFLSTEAKASPFLETSYGLSTYNLSVISNADLIVKVIQKNLSLDECRALLPTVTLAGDQDGVCYKPFYLLRLASDYGFTIEF